MRYAGDGYDFRRPIMSSRPPRSPLPAQQPDDVIDLTYEPDNNSPEDNRNEPERGTSQSSRPPRFGRNIMADVVDLEEEPSPERNGQASSPEVQFLGSTRRPPGQSQTRTTEPDSWYRRPPFRVPYRNPGTSIFNIIRRVQHQVGPPPFYLDRDPNEDLLRQEVAMRTRDLANPLPQTTTPFWLGEPPNEGIDLTIDLEEDVPLQLDYSITGFGARGESRPSHTYNPPPPPAEGFTRTANEDEVVICPNCDHELGTGDELRRQIWVSKSCGHVRPYYAILYIWCR